MSACPSIAVVAARRPDRRRAERLASRLGLPLARRDDAAPDRQMILALDRDRIELRERRARPGTGLEVDFSGIDLRQGSGNLSRRQPLARAVGRDTRTVLDATAGLGHDAFLLAAMGYHVTAAERSGVIAALLDDGLRALADDAMAEAVADRLNVVHADAIELLDAGEIQVEAVYIDPMYPPRRRRSALPKKPLRLLRQVVGDDDDAAELVEAAIRSRPRRVIVKRPVYAAPLRADPALQFGGKLARYDVYLPHVDAGAAPDAEGRPRRR